MDTDQLMTLADAAKLKGVSRQAVWNWIDRGYLVPVQIGGRPFLRRRDVEHFEQSPSGRPSTEAVKKKSKRRAGIR